VLARLTGARLCFGRPVEVKGRTVIPVASVRTAGGYGFGGEPLGRERSGGGGGALDARPVGFIEIGPEGTRFEAIDDGRAPLSAIAAGSLAVLVVGRGLIRRRRRALNGVPPRLRLRRGAQASQPS
jgi:uncharacterized spore protein YtfJ